ncbi:MAG: hypothetical protein AB7O59_19955 [Pirellulales bacterium]
MRSDYGKLLRREFEQELLAALPQFTRSNETQIPPGCRLYEWLMSKELTAYLLLVPSDSEHFTIEVGWTRGGPFPFALFMPEVIQQGSFRCRLSRMWNPPSEYWWKVTSQRTVKDMTLEEIGRFDMDFLNPPPKMTDADREVLRAAVDDAIQKIQQYAIPYFEQVAQEYGEGPPAQTSTGEQQ